MHDYVTSAFRLRFADQLAGLPAWADNSTYSIQAKIGEQTVKSFQSISYAEQWKLRGQMDLAVLEDDFHLRWHRESRIRPVYELVIAKGRIKMHLHPAGKPDSWVFHPGHVQAEAVSIHDLITHILSYDADIDRVVPDRTQLTGLYDLDLQWTPTGEQDNDTNSPAIFTALREQLGLELKSAKAPIDVIVIDSIARPTIE